MTANVNTDTLITETKHYTLVAGKPVSLEGHDTSYLIISKEYDAIEYEGLVLPQMLDTIESLTNALNSREKEASSPSSTGSSVVSLH